MKKIITILLALATVMTMSVQAKKGSKKSTFEEAGTLYIYGVSYSPTDSVVYMTDLLMLENAQISKRTKFLVNRNELSNQFKKHLTEKGLPNRTCAVTFKKSLNSIDKSYQKQVAALKKKGFLVKNIDQTEFRFNAVREEE